MKDTKTPQKVDELKKTEGKSGSVEEEQTLIDTSQMSEGQRAALEMTEAAREKNLRPNSFLADLYMGKWQLSKAYPFPVQTQEDMDQGDAFLDKLDRYLQEHVDADEIDRTGEIPDEVIKDLGDMGAFGIKIHGKYGGLGLSQTNYCRAAVVLGGHCGNLTALVSAHQSIGVPQPLILFGTEAQKEKYLTRIAKGEISAFALTEVNAGSDPAQLSTTAVPTEDGEHFIINGEKLWCTNSLKAGVIVVMAQTPEKEIRGRMKKQVTAFIVEMDAPGLRIKHRCRFMGLKALYNGVLEFKDVKVPRENIILGEGKGLKVALTTLNTGRLTLPAACVGMARKCLQYTRRWTKTRNQWGNRIGEHAAIADKVAKMAADTFAMESMVLLTSRAVDRDKHADIRLEAAMSKMWGTERAWDIVHETMQIRGGRGYETADSLQERGEEAIPVERFMRDCRINMIFEGSSEIMRLFVMREALEPHLRIGAAVFNTQLPLWQRGLAAMKAGLFYSLWYPKQWNPFVFVPSEFDRKLAWHLGYIGRTSRKMARTLFHQMVIYGPKLDKQQVLLGKFADIGAELFAMTAVCTRAQRMPASRDGVNRLKLADLFSEQAKLRIAHLFQDIAHNNNKENYRLAQEVLKGKFRWLESRIQ